MWKKGEITVFVSLMLAVLLFFFQACLQSARYAFLRSQAQEALELAEVSVLSEYHRGLLEEYGLFYLDLGYGTGQEDSGYLEQRIRQFLNDNLGFGKSEGAKAWDFSRPTDEGGMAYYEQAVSLEKQRMGAELFGKAREYEDMGKRAQERQADYEAADARERANLEELKRRREKEEEEGTADPTVRTEELKSGSILRLVLEDPGKISGKKADLSAVPSVRGLLKGTGARGKYRGNPGNDIFFHTYLLDRFSNAAEFLAEDREPGVWLDYQAEYLIAGEASDLANLEAVCARLLAVREGINYAYIVTDAEKVAECEAMALALAGATMIPGLVEALKQVLLLTWSFAESVADLRTLLAGKKVVFLKSADTWSISLEGALELGLSDSIPEGSGNENGLSYKDYLGILLALTDREQKTLGSLDVIENVIRRESGGTGFYIDQCTDSFQVRTLITSGRELSAERWFCYEW